MERKSYIYKCTNLVNGKVYIGQSINPVKRIKAHINSSAKDNYLLHYAIQKYGVENFLFEIIRSEIPIEHIDNTEIQCIKEHNCKVPNGYNITEGGSGNKGWIPTNETKEKIRIANLGRRHSAEFKEKCRLNNIGKKLSEETKKKISLANKNRIQSASHIENAKLARLGYKHSEESKQKMSLAKTGIPSWNKDKKHSAESILKMSIAHSNISEETRQKMSKSAKNRKRECARVIATKENSVLCFDSAKSAAIYFNVHVDNIRQRIRRQVIKDGWSVSWELKKENKN